MDDPYNDYRAQRRYYRQMRRYNRYRNPLGGLAGGLFILALFFAFLLHGAFGGAGFLVLLFIGLAFASLFGSISSMNRQGIYGGLHGFVWMLGLALCFWVGFWPWILLPVAISAILGSLFNPIMAGLGGAAFLAGSQMQQPGSQQQPYQQQYPPQGQPYQQGYQGAPPQQQENYQEGGQQHAYTPEPKQQYEQPQAQYPEQQQELPPMEQQ
jgi:hypothetical protein